MRAASKWTRVINVPLSMMWSSRELPNLKFEMTSKMAHLFVNSCNFTKDKKLTFNDGFQITMWFSPTLHVTCSWIIAWLNFEACKIANNPSFYSSVSSPQHAAWFWKDGCYVISPHLKVRPGQSLKSTSPYLATSYCRSSRVPISHCRSSRVPISQPRTAEVVESTW